ncbi:MAG: TonB C-terminal domain-containing protein [Terracidiphilus sp.]
MRIFALIFSFAILLVSLSAGAQTAPAGSTQDKPCGAQPNAPADKDGIVSDTQGVDLKPYLKRIFRIVQSTWNPLIPKEAGPPVNKAGEVLICFRILPSGKLMDGGMVLEGRSGDPALDRAAWGAVQTSVYPPLPAEFKGPYLELRFAFLYNPDRQPAPSRKLPKPLGIPGPVGITLGYNSKL